MGIEIERKFLLKNETWRGAVVSSQRIRQGYLSTVPERTVRVRVREGRAFLTIKGKAIGAARAEYEYPIPVDDAHEMLDTLALRPLIEKTRYLVDYQNRQWEIDVFSGENEGLVLAEIELPAADTVFSLPDWVGEEVTEDPRYSNSALVARPFRMERPGGGD